MLDEVRRRKQITSVILLQSYVRRHFDRVFVRLRRTLFHFVTLSIQRVRL